LIDHTVPQLAVMIELLAQFVDHHLADQVVPACCPGLAEHAARAFQCCSH
jgi:hypothetical protein